jgi:hypothetical protein
MFEQNHITSCSSRGFNVARLRELKCKAMRSGLWFKTLHRIDRALIDVTVRVAKSVYSATLAKALYSVIEKLESAFKSRVCSIMHRIGFSLAHKLSALAQKWGNYYARNWTCDESFAKFLAIMHINGAGASAI